MPEPKKRGGLRIPAGGRPPKAPEDRKVKVSITISQALHTKLLTTYPDEPLSQVIERLLSGV